MSNKYYYYYSLYCNYKDTMVDDNVAREPYSIIIKYNYTSHTL